MKQPFLTPQSRWYNGKSDSPIPALEPIRMQWDEAILLLSLYGIDQRLTEQDDARLWAAVIATYWPRPDAPKIYVKGLRFGIGHFDVSTEMKVQPEEGWCFERVDSSRLQLAQCYDEREIDAQIDKALKPLTGTTLFFLAFAGVDFPYRSLVFARPSQGQRKVPVYIADQIGPRMGLGQTCIWTSHDDGTWQQTGEILAEWIS